MAKVEEKSTNILPFYPDDESEGNHMSNDKNENYVTKEVLDLKLESISTKIDSKFDQLDTKVDSKFELLNNKFDQIPTIIELALSKQNEEQRKQKNELIKWFIGTFIAAIAVVIAYLSMN